MLWGKKKSRLNKAVDSKGAAQAPDQSPQDSASSFEVVSAGKQRGGEQAESAKSLLENSKHLGQNISSHASVSPEKIGDAPMTDSDKDKSEKMTQTETAKTAANGNGAGTGKEGSVFTEPTPGPERRTVANMLGEITWLMSQSVLHKNFFISDLEWMVMTPILLKQFRVFYGKDRPIGVALWAYASDEVAERLAQGNARLKPQDWKSGEELWLVDIIAPYGGHDEMIKDLKEKVFPEREIKFLKVEGGKPVVKTV